MEKQNFMREKAKYDALIALCKEMVPLMDGKEKTETQILLESDKLSNLLMDICKKYSDPRGKHNFSEQKLNEVLEYLGMVETGIRQFISQGGD